MTEDAPPENRRKAWWTPERRLERSRKLRRLGGRYPGLTEATRAEIRARAGHRCQRCGSDKSGVPGRKHEIHHVDHNKENQAPENLLVLCRKCHRREHRLTR